MSNGGYRVHILGPGYGDPLSQMVTIFVIRDFGYLSSGHEGLGADGQWHSIPEGAAIQPELGIKIPAEAIEALAVGVQRYQGHTSHADTEARVLREWLAVEQRRVDDLLKHNSPI